MAILNGFISNLGNTYEDLCNYNCSYNGYNSNLTEIEKSADIIEPKECKVSRPTRLTIHTEIGK